MEDIDLPRSPSVNKPRCSPLNLNRQRNDSATVIQQSDVSSSRPALLAHDALGPLLFEALDGFFFTINHNFELDFVSDNVAQYLKYSQEELAGRSLYHCVHPNDVGEFSKAWAKKDAGDSTPTTGNNEQQTVQSRGRTFICRMRTNDDSTPYVRMIVSVALHRDSLGSDKTFLICIARRPSLNDPKDKPSLLGFDQFSSRINLNYDIENLDSSHMKCETLDMNFAGQNFRQYVYSQDIPYIERHFEEVIEKGEAKSPVYRFCLHDDVYAFINTRSKLFHNLTTGKNDSILSTHTIVRLIENIHDLNGNASTRLVKSIISSNRDLQRNKQAEQKNMASPTTPIGTQFALTMLGMHKNASNSLQQHVSSTLGTLIQVQNSLSTSTINSPNDKPQSQQQPPPPSPTQNRLVAQKSSTLDNVSSTDAVEFGSKRTPISPSLGSIHSNHNSLSSPVNSFDIFFSSPVPAQTNSNDLNSFLASPSHPKTSSPLFSNNDIYTTQSSPKPLPPPSTPSRSSTRLRQLLTNKSPTTNENLSQTLQHHNETKLEDLIQGPESPSTTNQSPSTDELTSSTKRRRKHSYTQNVQNNPSDLLIKKMLGRPGSFSLSPHRTESNHSDDSSSGGPNTNKQRSDTFLRTLLNDEVRPQKVVVETPFAIGSRTKSANRRSSSSTNILVENNQSINNTRITLKPSLSSDVYNNNNNKTKKNKRPHSNSFGNQNNPLPRKPGRPKRDQQSDYLLSTLECQTPPSILSDGSLDALLDTSANLDHPSPIVLRRTTRQTSATNLKRLLDNHESGRKHAKLLPQVLLKDEIKTECQDHTIISPSIAVAAIKPINQSSEPTIKNEPDIFNLNYPLQTPMRRTNNNTNSTLLRTLIGTPNSSLPTKKDADAPLYDLLQNFDTSSSSTIAATNDPFEQYLTPILSQTSTTNNTSSSSSSTKDDYLAALLNSDPQKPNEISFIPTKQQQQITNDNNRITAIANDLFNSTNLSTNSNDDFLSLLDSRDFLDCLNDSPTIDSILSQNPSNLIEHTFPSTNTKRSEKDEKAISEIYKTLVTSFNPGSSQQSLSTIDSNNPFGNLSGDIFFTENTNRTVNSDPLLYNQSSGPPPLQSSSSYSYPSNNSQYPDCLSLDLLDNNGSFPPNVTLSPMNNSYPSQTTTTAMNTNSMMMYSQQTHHQTPQNLVYRQTSQHQQPMYNNYVQPPTNQTNPSYYSMPPSVQQPQQRMSPANHHQSQLVKRQTLMQQQQQRTPTQNNQQLQLHMSMNVTLPHMTPNQSQQQQQQQQSTHRPMMNSYNDLRMTNNTPPTLQPDYHQYPNNNPQGMPYSPDIYMSPSSNMGQQSVQNRHMNVMQHQQSPHPQSTMHQPYSNMNVALSATIQQNTHNSNNLMNSPIPNLTSAECRQSEEINNNMMNCLSFQPVRCTSEFVRKQLQNTIHGRQKPTGGKDVSAMTGHSPLPTNLDSNQKGAYFRNQLSSQMSTPPLQTTTRSQQQQQQPGKPS